MGIWIDPTSLRRGASRISAADEGLHRVASRVRGMPHPTGISGATISQMNAGIGKIHNIGVASKDQARYLNATANAAERIGGFGASMLTGFALNLRSPFGSPPKVKKPEKKVPWYKKVARGAKHAGGAGWDFTTGAASELYDTGKAFTELPYSPKKIKEAAEAAKWLAASPANRKAFLKQLAMMGYGDIAKEWAGGEKSKAAGRAAMRAGLNVLPVKKLAELAKLSKVVKLAQKASDSKIAKAAQKANDLKSNPLRTINKDMGKADRANAISDARKAREARRDLAQTTGIGPEERRRREQAITQQEERAKEQLRSWKEREAKDKVMDQAEKAKGVAQKGVDAANAAKEESEEQNKRRQAAETERRIPKATPIPKPMPVPTPPPSNPFPTPSPTLVPTPLTRQI